MIGRRRFIQAAALCGLLAFTGSAATAQEGFKAAIVMPGNITDQSWNQTGYEAIMRAKEELGIEVAHSEKVAQPDQLEAMSAAA